MNAVMPMDDHAIDAGVPWHYGYPFAEQRLLASGAGVVDLSHREVLEVTGEDRLSWLDSLTSQLLLDLAPGASTYDLLLDPHGRIESELHVVALDDRLLLTVEPGNGAAVLAFLDRMRFMLRVAVRDVTADWAVVWEPTRDPHPTLPTIPTPPAYAGLPMADAGVDVSNYRAPQEAHFVGREVLVPRTGLEAHLAAHEGRAGTWAWNALRIAAGVPRFGVETDDRTIPHELGLLGTAVHMRKGCYRGQETVAKVHTAARPPRRLVLLHLDGSDDHLPAHGAPVLLDGAEAGFVGMAVHHHELGPIASAVVRRAVPVDAEVEVDGQRATQQLVVRPETSGSANAPVGKVRMRMLGHR